VCFRSGAILVGVVSAAAAQGLLMAARAKVMVFELAHVDWVAAGKVNNVSYQPFVHSVQRRMTHN